MFPFIVISSPFRTVAERRSAKLEKSIGTVNSFFVDLWGYVISFVWD